MFLFILFRTAIDFFPVCDLFPYPDFIKSSKLTTNVLLVNENGAECSCDLQVNREILTHTVIVSLVCKYYFQFSVMSRILYISELSSWGLKQKNKTSCILL